MSKRLDGGAAFPITDDAALYRIGAAAINGIEDVDERDRVYTEITARAAQGMTLRDYLAAAALPALIQGAGTICSSNADHIIKNTAQLAYSIADATLEARGHS